MFNSWGQVDKAGELYGFARQLRRLLFLRNGALNYFAVLHEYRGNN